MTKSGLGRLTRRSSRSCAGPYRSPCLQSTN